MAATDNPAPSQRHKAGVQRMIKHPLKIDMTPMVDLGFLLITFFVITTELAKPTAMDLFMPKDGKPMPLGKSNALTVLLDQGKLYYYHGEWKDAITSGNIIETNFTGNSGLRKIINDKQLLLDISPKNKEGRNGLMILIKPGKDVSYKHLVNVLDEMTISMVKKYALIKMTKEEKEWLEKNTDKK
jgi:biopolymer transport protein ExbD